MSGRVVLAEYEDRRVALAPEDAAFVATRLSGRITVRRDLTDEGYILNPRQFVGLVTLPSGRWLECRPKVPVRNLFVLLAAAFDLPDPFLDAPAETDRIDDVLEFIVARFATLVAERIDRGLYRTYVEEEANLFTVRGRIAIAEDVRRNHVLRHQTYCRYAEYSWDVPENQLLRQAVRLVAGWPLRPELRRRLHLLDAVLTEVTPGRYAASDVDRFVYHRLNEEYIPVHRLCQLFLDGASLSEQAGTFGFEAFLVDMNRLFEAFVVRTLRERAPDLFVVQAQIVVSLDRAGTVPMRPDVLVHRADQVVVVADSKYKRLASGKHLPHDLYQMLAYCTALGVSTGLLVYPRHLAPVNDHFAIRHANVTIRQTAIDLSGDRDALREECDRFAHLVFDLTSAAPTARRVDS